MSRPKSLEKIELVPDITIRPEQYQSAYKGIVDKKGRVATVGIEFSGQEVYVFIKKPG